MGYGFVGDGFNCCRWVEIDGIWLIWSLIFGFVQWSRWVAGWVLGRFQWGFGSRWFAGWVMVGLGGSQWWFPFLVDSDGFGGGFFVVVLFYVAPNTQCRIFSGAFS